MTTEIQKKIDSATEHLNCSWETWEKQALKTLDTSLSSLKDKKDIHKENIQYLWKQNIESKWKSIDAFLQKDIKEQLLPSRKVLDDLTKTMETLSPEAQRQAVRDFIHKEIGAKLTVLCKNRDDVVAALQVYVNWINDNNGKHAQIPYDASKSYKNYSTGSEQRLFIDGILGPHTYKALWLALFGQDLDKIFIRKSSAIDERGVANFAWSSSAKVEWGEYVKNWKEYHPWLEAIKDKSAVWFVGSDGMVYLPGPDGLWKPYADPNDKYSMEKNNQRINTPEKLPLSYQKMNLFLGFYEIWKQEALNVAGSRNYLNSSWTEDESKIMRDKVAQIDTTLQVSIKRINENNNPKLSYSLDFDNLFKMVSEVENQEDVFGQGDVDSIMYSITQLKPGKYKEAELNIITKSRKKFGDALLDTIGLQGGGNSEWAKWWLIESRILNRPEFVGINTLISNPDVMDQIKSGNEAALTKEIQKCYILNKNALPLAKKMIKEYASIEQKVVKNKTQLRNQISDAGKVNGVLNVAKQKQIMDLWNKQNVGLKITTWDQYLNQATELATKSSIEMASMMYLRDLTIESKLTQKHLAWTAEDPDLKELKAILGVGGLGISDKNAEWCAEIASTVALSAVTMGAGMAIAKWALTAARFVAKATRIASLVVRLEEAAATWGKALNWANKLTKFGVNMSKITVEWVAFYEWSNTMTNLLTKNTELFDNAADWKEIGKSIAFMGALKVMWKYLGKLGEKIWAPTARVPFKILSKAVFTGVEWAALVGISQWVEVAFGGDFHPTWEEFIQAMLLARIASSAGKLAKGEYVFRKRKGGIVMEPQKALPEHKQPKALLEKNPTHPDDVKWNAKINVAPDAKTNVAPDTKTNVAPDTKTNVAPDTKTNVAPDTKTNVAPDAKTNVAPDANKTINKRNTSGRLAEVINFPLNSNNLASRPSIEIRTGDVITFKDWYQVRVVDTKLGETKYAFEGTPSGSAAWYKWEQWYKNWALFKIDWFTPKDVVSVNTWAKIQGRPQLVIWKEIDISNYNHLKPGDVITFKDWYRVRVEKSQSGKTRYTFEGTPTQIADWYIPHTVEYQNWELFKTEWFKPEDIRTINSWAKVEGRVKLMEWEEIKTSNYNNLKTGNVITFKDWYRVRVVDAKFWETKYAFEGTPSGSASWYKWDWWYQNWELFKTEWFKPEDIRTINVWAKKVWGTPTLISGQEVNIN